MAHEPRPQPHGRDVHYETSDANVRALIGFGAGLLATALLIHAAVWVLYVFLMARQGGAGLIPARSPVPPGRADLLPPEPRLQTNPREDLRRLRAREDQLLNSYGWVDQSAGVARIPIRRAMELTLERGLPARPSPHQEKR